MQKGNRAPQKEMQCECVNAGDDNYRADLIPFNQKNVEDTECEQLDARYAFPFNEIIRSDKTVHFRCESIIFDTVGKA